MLGRIQDFWFDAGFGVVIWNSHLSRYSGIPLRRNSSFWFLPQNLELSLLKIRNSKAPQIQHQFLIFSNFKKFTRSSKSKNNRKKNHGSSSEKSRKSENSAANITKITRRKPSRQSRGKIRGKSRKSENPREKSRKSVEFLRIRNLDFKKLRPLWNSWSFLN